MALVNKIARISPALKLSLAISLLIILFYLFFGVVPLFADESTATVSPFIFNTILGIGTLVFWILIVKHSKTNNKIFFILLLAAECVDTVNNFKLLVLRQQHHNFSDILVISYQLLILIALLILLSSKRHLLKVSKFHIAAIPLIIGLLILYFASVMHGEFASVHDATHNAIVVAELAIMFLCLLYAASARSISVLLLFLTYLCGAGANLTDSVQVWQAIAFPNALLGLINMGAYVFGFLAALFIYVDRDFVVQKWLLPINSLQPQVSLWSTTICLLVSLIIAIFFYTFDIAEIHLFKLRDLVPILCLFFIVTTILSIAAAKYLNQKLSYIINTIRCKTIEYHGDESNIRELSFINHFAKSSLLKIDNQYKNEKKLFKIASKAVHDIRSPLNLLQMLSMKVKGKINNEQEEKIQYISNRIHSITGDLLQHYREVIRKENISVPALEKKWLLPIIYEIFYEKEEIYKNRQVDFKLCLNKAAQSLQVKADEILLRRIVANLIDNAYQAIRGEGEVVLSLSHDIKNQQAELAISDTGSGFSQAKIDLAYRGELPSSKSKGSGIGLNTAIKTIRKWQGNFIIQSAPQEKTVICIQLPCESLSDSVITKFPISTVRRLVIFDDEVSELQWIKDRLGDQVPKVTEIIATNDIDDFQVLISQKNNTDLFLIDYYLGDTELTGVDYILQNKLQHQAILMSNNFDNALVATCEINNIRFLPKLFIKHNTCL